MYVRVRINTYKSRVSNIDPDILQIVVVSDSNTTREELNRSLTYHVKNDEKKKLLLFFISK